METEHTVGLTRGHVLLLAAIEKAGSQAELGRRVGVSRAAVHFWTRGAFPSRRAARMMTRYGIPISAWDEPASAA